MPDIYLEPALGAFKLGFYGLRAYPMRMLRIQKLHLTELAHALGFELRWLRVIYSKLYAGFL